MKRFFIAATLVLLGASTGSANYYLIKINLNKLNFHTETVFIPGGQPGAAGPGQPPAGPGVMPKGPGNPGAAPEVPPEDPNARWIYAFVEVKGPTSLAMQTMIEKAPVAIFQFENRWGAKNWYPIPGKGSTLPAVMGFSALDPLKDFPARFTKEKKDKDKSIEGLLDLARRTLQHGSMKRFHAVMKEAAEANPKHDVVVQYLRVKKQLESPFNNDDSAQAEPAQRPARK